MGGVQGGINKLRQNQVGVPGLGLEAWRRRRRVQCVHTPDRETQARSAGKCPRLPCRGPAAASPAGLPPRGALRHALTAAPAPTLIRGLWLDETGCVPHVRRLPPRPPLFQPPGVPRQRSSRCVGVSPSSAPLWPNRPLARGQLLPRQVRL